MLLPLLDGENYCNEWPTLQTPESKPFQFVTPPPSVQ